MEIPLVIRCGLEHEWGSRGQVCIVHVHFMLCFLSLVKMVCTSPSRPATQKAFRG